MSGFTFKDGDLVLVHPTTSGVILQRLADAGIDATVFVPGPAFKRENALSVAEFARRFEGEVVLTVPVGDTRTALSNGDASLLPLRISDYPVAMRRISATATRTVGVVEITPQQDGRVTPGICGLGVETIVELSDVLIGEVNPQSPRLPGLSITTDKFDHQVSARYDLPKLPKSTPNDRAERIGEHVADVVPAGATVQFGIGDVPAAVARELSGRTGLGLHSGLVGPEVLDLLDSGTIERGSEAVSRAGNGPTGGFGVASMVVGDSDAFYDRIAASEAVAIGSIAQSHDPVIVGENPRFTAINSGLQVDLAGQVNAEQVANRQVSAPGGQPDYFRAARRSDGGVGVLAMSSVDGEGRSKIRSSIADTGVVTTPRDTPDVVVTEHGVADLRTATVSERARRLLAITDPDHRADLRNYLVSAFSH